MSLNPNENKEKFIQIFNGEITRPGADAFLAWLDKTDFFTAPFTGQFALSTAGGACQHALNVYRVLVELVEKYRQLDPYYLLELTPETAAVGSAEYEVAVKQVDQSLAITGLLQSVCLADSWTEGVKNEKQPNGKWLSTPMNKWDERFIYGGRGAKSVFIIQQFMRLFVEEAQAIRFHMQGKEIPYGEHIETAFYQVYETNVLAALLGTAVNEATNVLDQMVWKKNPPKINA